MQVLYAVQGTGNGHLSRACAMAQAFGAHPEVHVNWLMSGREPGQAFGAIIDYQWRQGLTFVAESGRIRKLETLRKNDLRRFITDIREMDLSAYDLIISDFEPVVAHAARKRGIPVTGIGHQYAFAYDIPMRGANPLSRYILRHYAPASRNVGLHWHHFGFPLLPPLIDPPLLTARPTTLPGKLLVYLPFEDPAAIAQLFSAFGDYDIHIYHPQMHQHDTGHLHLRPVSRESFKHDLLSAERVICNSGFELIAECLQLGKAVLCKPLGGQMEQLSNAQALEQLGYADVKTELNERDIGRWLATPARDFRIDYPDVAGALASWIAGGCREEVAELSAMLWRRAHEKHSRAA